MNQPQKASYLGFIKLSRPRRRTRTRPRINFAKSTQ